jgi:hypothetical protein
MAYTKHGGMGSRVAIAGAASMIFWLLVGGVVVASVWHPFHSDSKSAASSAGWRLGTTFALFVALYFLPRLFDRGNLDGTDTCPYLVNARSDAWWVGFVVLGLTWWSGVGVLKASGASLRRRERHSFAVLGAAAAAIALALIGGFLVAFSQICP